MNKLIYFQLTLDYLLVLQTFVVAGLGHSRWLAYQNMDQHCHPIHCIRMQVVDCLNEVQIHLQIYQSQSRTHRSDLNFDYQCH